MADQSARKSEMENAETTQTSVGEEVRSSSVTGGTNGGSSNRPDYQPEADRIAPDEPGGTQGRGSHR